MIVWLRLLAILISIVISIPLIGQELIYGNPKNDSLYNKLYFSFASIEYKKKRCPSIKLPKRKYDSPLFSCDLIPFRTGYIINSITTIPGSAGRVEVSYKFYYLDLSDNSLKHIVLNELDTIHSLITVKDTLYASGKKGTQLSVYRYASNEIKEIPLDEELRTNSWIKLGFHKDELIALLENGLVKYRKGLWETFAGNPLQASLQKEGFKNKKWLIPTENIRVQKDMLYFVNEITQQRTSYLFEIDLASSQAPTEFFKKHSLTDNTKKEVDNYLIDNKGNLFLTVNRLSGNSIVLKVSEGKLYTIILNGFLESAVNAPTLIKATAIFEDVDRKLIFTTNGVFEWRNDIITPLINLERTIQEIKIEGSSMDFEYYPRAIQYISSQKYLVAGLWGGLYILDLSKNKITCLDNLDAIEDIKLF